MLTWSKAEAPEERTTAMRMWELASLKNVFDHFHCISVKLEGLIDVVQQYAEKKLFSLIQ